jgi:hypothetical protein
MGTSKLVLVLRRRPRGLDGLELLFAGACNAARVLGSPASLEQKAISRTTTTTTRKGATNA